MALALDISDLQSFLNEVFPQVEGDFTIIALTQTTITVNLNVGTRHLRPGGTVSGPSMFALADVAVYMMVLARIGREALTVTTNASLDFMRKPTAGRDLRAECRLLKLGRALAVADVLIFSEGDDAPVARANMTYAIPPK